MSLTEKQEYRYISKAEMREEFPCLCFAYILLENENIIKMSTSHMTKLNFHFVEKAKTVIYDKGIEHYIYILKEGITKWRML